MSTNFEPNGRGSHRTGSRALLLGTAAFLAIGAMTAHAATTNTSSNTRLSGFMSASLAAILAAKNPAPTPTAPSPTPTAAQSVRPAQFGMNLTTLSYWANDRAFANLIYGSSWTVAPTTGGWTELPANSDVLDANGWIKRLPANATIVRTLTQPIARAGGSRIRCTYDGSGVLNIHNATNVQRSSNALTFTLTGQFPVRNSAFIQISQTDQSNYIRNIDCREADLVRSAQFAPEFVSSVRGYRVLRFMDWMNTNQNLPVDVNTRNVHNGATYMGRDGVPVEAMLDLVELTGADPWFAMSWNASDAYVERFAQEVRRRLKPGQKIYVELSNEVWNGAFPIATQAQNEGLRAGLSTNPTEAQLRRYAQRSSEVLRIWTRVFAGAESQLVRVVNTMSVNDWSTRTVLDFGDTANWVDAVAIAPYFAYSVPDSVLDDTLNPLFSFLGNEVRSSINAAKTQKQVAARYGKRLIAYEAGQHITMPGRLELLERINRDPRMYDLYRAYLNSWRTEVGDTMVLFANVSPISQYGAWGIQEYAGQPESETPKRRAILEFLR